MTWTGLLSFIRCRGRRRCRRRGRQAAEAAAQALQVTAHLAARQRILDLARRNDGPVWNAPTMPLPAVDRPLMTPAQRFRGNGGRR
ncbi:MAG TPA: hypothetical protein VF755_03590 [Catenuloplanes sp.]|jgi:hypothetical protein